MNGGERVTGGRIWAVGFYLFGGGVKFAIILTSFLEYTCVLRNEI